MADMDRRQAIISAVSRSLAHKDYADRFEAFGPNRERVILAALPDDLMSSLWSEVKAVGGSANVVVPLFEGLVCFAMTPTPAGRARQTAATRSSHINGECTVGVMLARLIEDGGSADYAVHMGSKSAGLAQHPRFLQAAGA